MGILEKGTAADELVQNDVVPALWAMDYPLDMFIDCPMHLLFTGIVGAVIEMMEKFMTKHGHATGFVEHINIFLLDISSFRLSYCVLKEYPKKSWVSENHLAVARLLPFIYGQYFLNNQPTSARDESTSTESVTALKRVINALYVMLSRVMTREPIPEKEDIDLAVKIFLDCCHRYCKSFLEPSENEFWGSKGNFLR